MSIFGQLKGNLFYLGNKRLAQLQSGPLLLLLSLSGQENLLYGNSDHIFFMATTYSLY